MSELAMSEREREEFLAALHVGVLAVDRPDGPPLMTPIWYRYAPGGAVEFNTAGSSEKAQLLMRSGYASLCAQREELPYAYVTVDGPVEVEQTDRATRVDIATRYLGTELGTQYVAGSPDADDLVIPTAARRGGERATSRSWTSLDNCSTRWSSRVEIRPLCAVHASAHDRRTGRGQPSM